jgi:fidgetin-like protein 1
MFETQLSQHGVDTRTHVKLSGGELDRLASSTEGYSCADIKNLCRDAAMQPVRELDMDTLKRVDAQTGIRPVVFGDFAASLGRVRPSVSSDQQQALREWNKEHGSA